MRTIFEEYGKVILAIIVAVALLALIFGGVQLFKVMGDEVNVETSLNHSDSADAVKEVSIRTAPEIDVSYPYLHLYVGQVFKPVTNATCRDAVGSPLTPKVTSMVFIDSEGNKTELLEFYNAESDELDLSSSELPEEVKQPGMISVTFRAVDSYNIVGIRTLSYVVDGEMDANPEDNE